MICQYLVVDKIYPKCVWDYHNNAQCLFASSGLGDIGTETIDCIPASGGTTGVYVASEALRTRHIEIRRVKARGTLIGELIEIKEYRKLVSNETSSSWSAYIDVGLSDDF